MSKSTYVFNFYPLQVKAKLLFAKHRLVCVAQQLWSENVGVAIAAAAALWMLGRDDATRRALSQLCLDTEAAVHGASVVAAAVEKATTAKNHAASVQAQVNVRAGGNLHYTFLPRYVNSSAV
jgi:hypothetical protein